jgi:hypothetical protein
VPIVASIIAVAVGDDLLIAEPWHAAHGVGAHISALALSAIVGALLVGLALWESPRAAHPARGTTGVRHGRAWRVGERPSMRQQQQEGTSS